MKFLGSWHRRSPGAAWQFLAQQCDPLPQCLSYQEAGERPHNDIGFRVALVSGSVL
ncbi:hypothetical protein QUB75_10690 [Microcoleus sp. K1-B6]|uniref:hypothetical protein n=1 Tax=unclassified Microcoleus TaxID=2642155 RepID=UPI002FD1B76D